MYATTSFTCSKQVVDVEQQVILEEHKVYINWHKYFCPLRRVIDPRHPYAYGIICRRIIICPRHWPPACLRSWAKFNFAGKPAVVGDENILCEHHLRTRRTPIRRFDPYLPVKCWKLRKFDLHFTQISVTSAMHRRCAGDPLGQIAERCQLLPATTSKVGQWDVRTRLT